MVIGSLVCHIFLCFCYFPIWCPRSGVVNIVSVPDLCLLPYFDLGTFSLIKSHWAAVK